MTRPHALAPRAQEPATGAGSAPVEASTTRRRLVLMAEERLVGDTVRVALRSRGFDAVAMPWPPPHRPPAEHRRQVRLTRSRVGVIFGDLETTRRRSEARAVVEAAPLRWLLVVSDPGDAVWGGMVHAGAAGVLPTSVGLDDLTLALSMLFGGQDLLSAGRRRAMVEAWRRSESDDRRSLELTARLSTREREILALLYEGVTVAEIAARTGVSEQTVRSQVKAVLRKLEVNSQLAAVAVYRRVVDRR
ncbi:response regulator transcription factor [Nocardioides abyssi]|uniref:LuxR C-terminal-related transcriptional regulator n=1 Tax=Nocardioides abyssi TaxID=3058370 RepID=A0ABT8EUE5_9ACTN|nr:LuxR C-terminal-related transcriptional regulator [Nocardioides abyssi]MDN4161709.1 LuxR C-terminal-related transcriptional regulator [Nocardioides abyssi]